MCHIYMSLVANSNNLNYIKNWLKPHLYELCYTRIYISYCSVFKLISDTSLMASSIDINSITKAMVHYQNMYYLYSRLYLKGNHNIPLSSNSTGRTLWMNNINIELVFFKVMHHVKTSISGLCKENKIYVGDYVKSNESYREYLSRYIAREQSYSKLPVSIIKLCCSVSDIISSELYNSIAHQIRQSDCHSALVRTNSPASITLFDILNYLYMNSGEFSIITTNITVSLYNIWKDMQFSLYIMQLLHLLNSAIVRIKRMLFKVKCHTMQSGSIVTHSYSSSTIHISLVWLKELAVLYYNTKLITSSRLSDMQSTSLYYTSMLHSTDTALYKCNLYILNIYSSNKSLLHNTFYSVQSGQY